MAIEARTDVHHGAPRCLLRHFDAAAGGFVDWSEFEAEAECWGIEVCGLFREDLAALIESSTCEIPTAGHRRLHQEASDFVRWGRRGDSRTLALYSRQYFSLLACFRRRRVQPNSRPAIGTDHAATLMLTVGDNPEGLGSEASFASLCGVSPRRDVLW